MGLAQEFEKEKLIMGFIFNNDEIFEKALTVIKEKFKGIVSKSKIIKSHSM